jgi:hypothetical protein
MVMPAAQFERQMRREINDYREALRQGKLDRLGIDDLRPQMRDLRVIEAELDSPTHLPIMIASKGIENPVEAAILALSWAFRVDDESIVERKEKMLAWECQRIDDAERRRVNRDQKRKSK